MIDLVVRSLARISSSRISSSSSNSTMRGRHNPRRPSLGASLCRAFCLSAFVVVCASFLAVAAVGVRSPRPGGGVAMTRCPPGVRCLGDKHSVDSSSSSSSASASESASASSTTWFNLGFNVPQIFAAQIKPVALSIASAPGAEEPRADPHFVAAAASGDVDLMKVLIAAGASVDGRTGTRGNALFAASAAGRDAAVELLLASGAAVDARDIYGGSPLIVAATEGRAGIIELLLKAGATVTHTRVNDGATALLRASRGGHLRAVELLISAKNENNAAAVMNALDKQGRTALMYAAQIGSLEIVVALIAGGADVNIQAPDRVTALQWATERKHQKIADALVAAGEKV